MIPTKRVLFLERLAHSDGKIEAVSTENDCVVQTRDEFCNSGYFGLNKQG